MNETSNQVIINSITFISVKYCMITKDRMCSGEPSVHCSGGNYIVLCCIDLAKV